MSNSTLIFETWNKSAALEDVKSYLAGQDAARQATANEAAPLLADKELIADRASEGLKSAVQTGFLLGLLGAAMGAPFGLAAPGAAAGMGTGIPLGTLLGQARANKKFLKSKGIEASTPNPLPALLLPPVAATGATTFLPGSGHLNLKKIND